MSRSTEVLAFNKVTLAPVTLPYGSFGGTFVPRGIVHDSARGRFLVANGGANVNIYDARGQYLSTFNENVYGPSGAAYDALNGTIWIANFTGGSGVGAQFGVAEYNGDGTSAATLNPQVTFLAPQTAAYELPYAIASCQPQYVAATGTLGPQHVVVGYFTDNSNRGFPQAAIYTRAGKLVAGLTPALNGAQQPNSLACSSNGTIYVGTNLGLLVYDSAGVVATIPPGLAGLPAPIFAVYATY